MPTRVKPWLLLLAAVSLLPLAGCVFTLAPVQFLPRQALASVSEVAVAIEANGQKHYAWTECSGSGDTLTCVLAYARTRSGGVVYEHAFVQAIGTFASSPDVAVTDSGVAYVVRSVCSDFENCVDFWSMFPADPDGVAIDTNILHTSALPSMGAPLVHARGNDVYASYLTDEIADTRLRYRQLSGGNRAGAIDISNREPSDPSLAIDSAGDLHVVWLQETVTDTLVAYSNNTGVLGDFPAAGNFEAGDEESISPPDIALDGSNRAYVAYSIFVGLGDTIKVRCLDVPADCYRDATLLTVPESDGPWDVYRSLDLELIGVQPNLVFAATNSGLSFNEVWWYHPLTSGIDTPPTRVTNTPTEHEDKPLIIEENSQLGDVPVIGWRMFSSSPLGRQAPAGATCYGAVYVTFETVSNTRLIFGDRGTCNNAGFDMAANGEWVVGVWPDRESNAIASNAAWTAFNAYRSDLPTIVR